MTDDELEAASTRYIAPRIMRLASGRIALIPMLGRDPPRFIEPSEFSLDMIPTYHDLEVFKAKTEATMRSTFKPQTTKPPKPTLDDLA